MVPVDSWLARISRLRNWSEIRLTIVSWADGATFYWIWDDLWLPWCTFLYSRMVLTILFSLLLGHLLVFVDSITWEANWELVFLFRLAFLYSSCVYRFSLSFRSATAISDVARACRSKKKVVPRNLKILVVWQRPSMALVLLRSRFATEICTMANGIGFGPA